MSTSDAIKVSDTLAAALTDFRPFLLADDVERSETIAASDSETLRKLVDTVEPLFDEINATLDVTYEGPSLSDEEQDLESDLHSLAQAAEEARIELESRGE